MKNADVTTGNNRLPLLRAVFHALCLAVIIASFARWREFPHADVLPRRMFFHAVFLVLLAGVILAATLRPALFGPRRPRALAAADLVLTNLWLTILVAEGVLTAAAHFSDSPLFWRKTGGSENAERTVEQFRRPRLTPYFDTRFNSGGYLDDEFFSASERDFVAALLADSFGVGVVPFRYNFATVAEEKLRRHLGERFDRVAVHNFGVSAIGLPEYAWLLRNEAAAYHPSLVILCVFVGNDLDSGLEAEPAVPRCFAQSWWIWKTPKRLMAWVRVSRRDEENLATIGETHELGHPLLAYLFDTSLEPPSLTEEKFMEMEAERLSVCHTRSREVEARYQRLFDGLRHFRDLAGDALLVQVIPDEYQVDDDLWTRLVADRSDSEAFERDYPQRRIAEFCEREKIDFVDPLGDLRRARKIDRPYHLRDSHWNSFGNLVAGHNLGRHILSKRFGIDVPAAPLEALHAELAAKRRKP